MIDFIIGSCLVCYFLGRVGQVEIPGTFTNNSNTVETAYGSLEGADLGQSSILTPSQTTVFGDNMERPKK
jgi:hypothetical protein